jgi:hypothetical protein
VRSTTISLGDGKPDKPRNTRTTRTIPSNGPESCPRWRFWRISRANFPIPAPPTIFNCQRSCSFERTTHYCTVNWEVKNSCATRHCFSQREKGIRPGVGPTCRAVLSRHHVRSSFSEGGDFSVGGILGEGGYPRSVPLLTAARNRLNHRRSYPSSVTRRRTEKMGGRSFDGDNGWKGFSP